MKKLTLGLALLSSLLLTTVAFAHGGHHHDAKGTIQAIDEVRLTLEELDGDTEVFDLADTTIILCGDEECSVADVVVGERAVVIHEEKGGRHIAIEVKLAPRKK